MATCCLLNTPYCIKYLLVYHFTPDFEWHPILDTSIHFSSNYSGINLHNLFQRVFILFRLTASATTDPPAHHFKARVAFILNVLQLVMIPLTADCGIFGMVDIAQLEVLCRWHACNYTMSEFTVFLRATRLFTNVGRSSLDPEWRYTPVEVARTPEFSDDDGWANTSVM